MATIEVNLIKKEIPEEMFRDISLFRNDQKQIFGTNCFATYSAIDKVDISLAAISFVLNCVKVHCEALGYFRSP